MFLTPLLLEADVDADQWVVRAPLVWTDETYGLLSVPVGTRTDLASIPRRLRDWRVFDPNGPSRRPAVMHDWLYADGSRGKDFADKFLRDALKVEGLGTTAAGAYYWAVRLFGGPAWDGHRKATPV